MASAPAIIFEAVNDVKLVLRGQVPWHEIGFGVFGATTGMGIAAPVLIYFVRQFLLQYEKPPAPSNPMTSVDETLARMKAELSERLGEILWGQQSARAVLDQILQSVQEPAAQWSEEKRRQAEQWYRRGLIGEAVSALELAVSPEFNPTNFAAHRLLGHIQLFDRGRYLEAMESFRKAAYYAGKVAPRDAWHRAELAIESAEASVYAAAAAIRLNRLEQALAFGEDALNLDFGLLEAYYLNAQALARLQDGPGSTLRLERAILGSLGGLRLPSFSGDLSYYFLARRDPEFQGLGEVQDLLYRLEGPVREQVRQLDRGIPEMPSSAISSSSTRAPGSLPKNTASPPLGSIERIQYRKNGKQYGQYKRLVFLGIGSIRAASRALRR